MKAKYEKKQIPYSIKKFNFKKITKDKLTIFIIIVLCIFYRTHNVCAFDYPEKPENYYVLDKANVLSVETEHLVNDINYNHYKEKKIDSSLVTISEPVGDKKEYTKQLKKWWEIGTKNNGFLIAIYPESKDCVEIVIDDTLKTYISNADVSRYKERIENGIKKDNLDDEVKIIIQDLEILLKGYTKKDTFIEVTKMTFDNLMFSIKPKEKANPFGGLLHKIFIGFELN